MKKKILIANDAHYLGTGYGVYGKEILTRLHNSGKYEVAEIGCYSDGKSPILKECPWQFYPAIPDPASEAFKAYKSNMINQFGAFVFSQTLLDFKPDIVFDVRDYWMYSYQETHPYRPFFKWVVMPTVDSAPQKEEWLYTFANMDMVVPYTQWAKNTLEKQCGSQINLFPKIANAGINPTEFFPKPNKKLYQKTSFGQNVFVTGLVMRNQKRKLFPDFFQAYRTFLDKLLQENKVKDYEKHCLYLHTSYPEESGWDLPALLLEHNLLDKTYFTYICKSCQEVYHSKFNNSITKCKKCGNLSAVLPSAANPVPTNKLNDIYNLFDFFVQYAICEGFGMPQVEAASCGIPLASVDYSAMSEIVENLEGYKIPCKRMFRELETGADRCYPDISSTVDILYDFYVNKTLKEKEKMGEKTRKLCEQYYTWDKVYETWDQCFDEIDITTKESWDSPRRETYQEQIAVPSNLSPAEFIEFICKEIIAEEYLLNSSLMTVLMKNFSNGIFAAQGGIKSYKYSDIAKMLESYLGNKVTHEDMRINNGKR